MKKHCIDSLFFDLDQASRTCRLFGERNFKENCKYDLVFDEFIIMDVIAENPDICQADLAEMLLKGTSHVSKLLAQLSAKGFIKRPVDTKGNRVIKKVVLTKKGLEAYEQTKGRMAIIIKEIEKTIDKDEVEACRAFLRKIKSAIKENIYKL